MLLFFGCSQFNERQYRDIAKEITSVETGLRSSVQFTNDPTWNIDKRMTHYGVPGVSIAVIKDYKIHWIKHYGVTDKETGLAVDAKTLFQAGKAGFRRGLARLSTSHANVGFRSYRHDTKHL